jgi:CheY-like chemotaxis protein
MNSGLPRTAVEKTPEARLRVLVVEDNIVNQRLALTLLKRLGWTASLACNGFDAIAAIERENFGLVLMDVQMPVMDGLMATQEIRRRFPPECQPAIIAFTANTLSGDRERCLAAGMDDYLSKPVDPAEMAAKLERWNAVLLKDGRGSFVPLFQKSPDLQPA